MTLKILAVFIIAAVLCLKSNGQQVAAKTTGTLTVTMNNFRSSKGQVGIALYNTANGFPKSAAKAISIIYAPVNNNKSVASFQDLPAGEYAISICHDENNNKKLDTNFFGIPKEGIGASNNARAFMGPPKYKDAKFNFSGKAQTVTIAVTYF